ncbi:hypothetical protein EJ06DRAFT_526740 [Trichodelitschia bisporula]|uniref:Uncharacterized protein n=1 Tax=Trichodelitschia bisporula TaxID=703511 RepID=A0A6G1I8R6_9PEZI|nr:hypothetical protein EJ06DRAFT_526740 [Trichodelitschia bisporula]
MAQWWCAALRTTRPLSPLWSLCTRCTTASAYTQRTHRLPAAESRHRQKPNYRKAISAHSPHASNKGMFDPHGSRRSSQRSPRFF